MRHAPRVLLALVVSSGIGGRCLQAQTSNPGKEATATAAPVRPIQVDIVALQVSKLPRNQFGQGIKPGTNETVAFWLANSGTALDLRLKLDRRILRCEETACQLIRFTDDKGGDLTRPPDGVEVNTFFHDNKPVIVKLGPKTDEAEVILRGYGTPAPGATKLQVHADLVFVGGSGERTADSKDLDPKPGTEATVGPLHLTFIDPSQVPVPPKALLPPGRRDSGSNRVAFEYEPPERTIKTVTILNEKGATLQTLQGQLFASDRDGVMMLGISPKSRIRLRVVYFEKSDTITVPIRLETGIGF